MSELSINVLDKALMFKRPRQTYFPSCSADGCNATTNEGKPYCSDHVTQMPYAVQLQQALSDWASEDKRARNDRSRPSIDSPTCQDMLLYLSEAGGALSVPKLAKLCSVEQVQILGYLRTLKYHKRVTSFKGPRGKLFVELVCDG